MTEPSLFHKSMSLVAAMTACLLMVTIGAVVIPKQWELDRQQEKTIKTQELVIKNQLEILQRLAAVEGSAKTAVALWKPGDR